MRSFLKLAILAGILWSPLAWTQAKMNLFVIEKPLEAYQENKLNELLTEAMNDLLVRVTGGEEVLEQPEAQKYLKQPKRWVKSFHFENAEVDGVVVGQKLVVSFDESRLLAEFQQDEIHIWPLINRPKTLMLGNFNQKGLVDNLSLEALQYRIDMDYRNFSKLVGLAVEVPAANRDYARLGLATLARADNLKEAVTEDFSNYDYVLLARARSTSEGVEIGFKLFSVKSGRLILDFSKEEKTYLTSLKAGFLELLSAYSAPYRKGVENFGIIQLEIEGLKNFKAYAQTNAYLQGLKPSMREVKLMKLEGDKASYELFYQGSYDDLVAMLKRNPKLKILDESRFTGTISTRAIP